MNLSIPAVPGFLKSNANLPAWLVDFVVIASLVSFVLGVISIFFPIPLITAYTVSGVAGLAFAAWVKFGSAKAAAPVATK